MASIAPLIGPIASLVGTFIGGSKAPKPPEPIAPPPPPPPPAPPKTVDPQETVAAEQDRVRSLRRRAAGQNNLIGLQEASSSKSKTLLGE